MRKAASLALTAATLSTVQLFFVGGLLYTNSSIVWLLSQAYMPALRLRSQDVISFSSMVRPFYWYEGYDWTLGLSSGALSAFWFGFIVGGRDRRSRWVEVIFSIFIICVTACRCFCGHKKWILFTTVFLVLCVISRSLGRKLAASTESLLDRNFIAKQFIGADLGTILIAAFLISITKIPYWFDCMQLHLILDADADFFPDYLYGLVHRFYMSLYWHRSSCFQQLLVLLFTCGFIIVPSFCVAFYSDTRRFASGIWMAVIAQLPPSACVLFSVLPVSALGMVHATSLGGFFGQLQVTQAYQVASGTDFALALFIEFVYRMLSTPILLLGLCSLAAASAALGVALNKTNMSRHAVGTISIDDACKSGRGMMIEKGS